MVKAIVYTSKTGFTRKYAELFAKEINVSAYELSDRNTPLSKNDDVIFFGWTMASSIQGLKKAKKKYSILAICAVGMSLAHDKSIENLMTKNNTAKIPLFYAQGGYDHSKQKFPYKFMMNMFFKSLNNPARMSLSEEQAKEIQYMITNGMDSVSYENITEMILWAKKEH